MTQDYLDIKSLLKDIANSVRAKLGTQEEMNASDIPDMVDSIVTDPSGDCTATNNDILSGKTAYAANVLRTGNIPTKTDEDITESSGIITIPSGYYALQYTKLGDPSGNCDATDGDILYGKTAYAGRLLRTGTIPSKSSSDLTSSGDTVSVPSGYYPNGASKSVSGGSVTIPQVTSSLSTPSISVNGDGLITASVAAKTAAIGANVSAGYVSSVSDSQVNMSASSNTLQMTTQGATTYNTSSSDQTISSGRYLTGNQTIKAVTTSNISAGNIKKGVQVLVGDGNSSGRIANVTGSYSTVSSGQTALSAGVLLSGYSGFANGGSEVKGSMANKSNTSQSASVSYNSSNSTYTVTIPANGYYTTGSTLYNSSAIKSVLSFKAGSNSSSYAQILWQYPYSGPFNGVRILRKNGSNLSFSGPTDSSATVISSGTTGSAVSSSGGGYWYYFNDTSASQATRYSYAVYPYIIVNGSYYYGAYSGSINHYRCSDRYCSHCYNCGDGCSNCCNGDTDTCCEYSCPWQSCNCDCNSSCCNGNGCDNCCDFDCSCNGNYRCTCYGAY